MVNTLLYFAVPIAVTALATIAGVVRMDAKLPDPFALVGPGLVGIAFAVLAATTHQSDVPTGEAVVGIAGAGLVLGALPPYIFFELGRNLAGREIALVLVCAAGSVALSLFYIIGWIVVLDVVHCPPDAYECPF